MKEGRKEATFNDRSSRKETGGIKYNLPPLPSSLIGRVATQKPEDQEFCEAELGGQPFGAQSRVGRDP